MVCKIFADHVSRLSTVGEVFAGIGHAKLQKVISVIQPTSDEHGTTEQRHLLAQIYQFWKVLVRNDSEDESMKISNLDIFQGASTKLEAKAS